MRFDGLHKINPKPSGRELSRKVQHFPGSDRLVVLQIGDPDLIARIQPDVAERN